MAKDHGPTIKDDKQYEGLRKKGMSKERAAKIANTPDASEKGGKRSHGGGSSQSSKSSGSGQRWQPRPEAGRRSQGWQGVQQELSPRPGCGPCRLGTAGRHHSPHSMRSSARSSGSPRQPRTRRSTSRRWRAPTQHRERLKPDERRGRGDRAPDRRPGRHA